MSAIPTTFRIEIEREADSRWLAEVVDVNGAMAYGSTQDEAVRRAKALALRILAERLEHGEPAPQAFAFAVAERGGIEALPALGSHSSYGV